MTHLTMPGGPLTIPDRPLDPCPTPPNVGTVWTVHAPDGEIVMVAQIEWLHSPAKLAWVSPITGGTPGPRRYLLDLMKPVSPHAGDFRTEAARSLDPAYVWLGCQTTVPITALGYRLGYVQAGAAARIILVTDGQDDLTRAMDAWLPRAEARIYGRATLQHP